eukprot:COSAG02_NODE_24551_length_684_cov_1.541880_1_plen_77_part_10
MPSGDCTLRQARSVPQAGATAATSIVQQVVPQQLLVHAWGLLLAYLTFGVRTRYPTQPAQSVYTPSSTARNSGPTPS